MISGEAHLVERHPFRQLHKVFIAEDPPADLLRRWTKLADELEAGWPVLQTLVHLGDVVDGHDEDNLVVIVVDSVEGVDDRIEGELYGVVLDGRLTAVEVVVEVLEEDDATMGDRGEHQHHVVIAPVGVELNHVDG